MFRPQQRICSKISEESLVERSGAEPRARVIKHSAFLCYIDLPTGRWYGSSPIHQLQEFLRYCSTRPVDPWEYGDLSFEPGVLITRRMITILRPLLHCDEASSSLHDDDNNFMDVPPGHTRNTQNKFSSVHFFDECRFFSQDDDDERAASPFRGSDDDDVSLPNHDDNVCTPDDKLCLLSALSSCKKSLAIIACAEILSDFLNMTEIDHLEAESLELAEHTPLTDLEYARLGAIIENSVKLTDLQLALNFADVPQAFRDRFANRFHMQSLCVEFLRIPDNQSTNDQMYAFFSKMVANEHRNGALERLLRNPQNQLKELRLSIGLEDQNVMVFADLLLVSHIERINLQTNNIKAPGFFEFARQLPNIPSLTNICLLDNPWEESSLEVLDKCGATLLHGLIENPSIEYVDCIESFPQCPLLWHYCSLNYAGRKLLSSTLYGEQTIPDGLWPHVLSRAGRPIRRGVPIFDEFWNYPYNGPANAVYFFLHHSKILFWQKSLSIFQKDGAGVNGTP